MKSKTVLILLASVLFLSACGPSKEETVPEESAIEMPVAEVVPAEPEPVQIVCSIQEKQHEDWEPVFCDTFDDNSYNWELGVDYDNGLETIIEDGKLLLELNPENKSGYSTGFSLAKPIWNADNYVLSVLGEMQSKFKTCTWGVLLNGFYETGVAFDIDNQGRYFVTDYAYAGDIYIGNADSGSNSAIKWDAPNTITVVAEDGKYLFFVNGTMLSSYEPANTSQNDISVSMWAAEGVRVSYEIDHVLVREK